MQNRPELTEKELTRAFDIWYYNNPAKEIDKALLPFLNLNYQPRSDWLQSLRQGLFLTAETISKKLNLDRSTYSKYEKSEMKGSITIATLQRVADAMDCELIYALRPKQKQTCGKVIWESVLPIARTHPWMNSCYHLRRGEALAAIALRFTDRPQFRRNRT